MAAKMMKEYDTLKVYGEIVNRWTAYSEEKGREITSQVEVAYKEYDRDGNQVGAGTEDFSRQRWVDQVSAYMLWGWDGETRNKAGQKWFRCLCYRSISRSDVWKLRQVAAAWYKDYNFAQIDARAF